MAMHGYRGLKELCTAGYGPQAQAGRPGMGAGTGLALGAGGGLIGGMLLGEALDGHHGYCSQPPQSILPLDACCRRSWSSRMPAVSWAQCSAQKVLAWSPSEGL